MYIYIYVYSYVYIYIHICMHVMFALNYYMCVHASLSGPSVSILPGIVPFQVYSRRISGLAYGVGP